MANYKWENGTRISLEDGKRLLKTNEAAEVLGVPIEYVRSLVRKGKIFIKGTYAFGYGKGWLLSEKDVLALKDDPEVQKQIEQYRERKAKAKTVKMPPPLPKAKVRPLKKRRHIKPDEFQKKAVEHTLSGSDVLLVAPTGAGKTWVAEEVARHAMDNGCRFIYASPIKALSNQKYRDFSSRFGEDAAGIITGDVSVNPQARVLVMTTEIFRNKCLCTLEDLEGVRWVIIDEFHLIDSDRGSAWEEAVIFAPRQVTLLCLSATIPNYQEIAAWMEWVREKKVQMVVADKRPVPLSWRWAIEGKVLTEKTAPRKIASLQEAKEERYFSRRHYGGYEWRDYVDWGWEEDWDDDDY